MINPNGVAIRYSDVAPEAKENFTPATSDKESFVNLSELQLYEAEFPNYSNPCEVYSVPLDGNSEVFPSDTSDARLGLWSNSISGSDGWFETPVVLSLTASGQYSSQGITLTFDMYNDIFATDINIKWYRAGTVLSDMDFTPDRAAYFCRNFVENYDKVEITFRAINMPGNRLKLRVIDYGYDTVFYGAELRSVKLIQELDPISSEIAINTCDFTLDSKTDMEYSFQAKQPLSVYFNGRPLATTFVKKSKRKARRIWDIQSEDYIGMLDGIPYAGEMFFLADAYAVMSGILTLAKVPFEIDEAFRGMPVTGYIPYTTSREALMQVAFAVGAVVDTSNGDVVRVFKLKDTVTQTIPLQRIMQGQSFADDETVTAVEVTAHTYTAITETVDLYKASESGLGNNIFVKFSEPLHDLSITNGTILVGATNYAIINASSGCVLKGQKYEHTTISKRKENPLVLAGTLEKVVAIENATLVSSLNVDSVLERCYAWLVKTNTTNLKIVEGKHVSEDGTVTYDEPVNVGDVIESETEYLETVSGRIIKETFGLNGGIVIKEAVLK